MEKKPFRAIFAAYDTVLAQNGLDPDRDQLYLRFLLRLGNKKDPGLSLYDSFELLLGELGIQIEFDPEENAIQDVTRDVDVENGFGLDDTAISSPRDGFRRQSRRASFNSMYDLEDGSTRASRSRPTSRATMSRLQDSQNPLQKPRSSSRATTRPTERTTSQLSQAQVQSRAIQQHRGRLTAQEFAANVQFTTKTHASASRNAANHARNGPFSRDQVRRPQTSVVDDVSLAEDSLGEDAQTSKFTHETRSPEAVAQREVLDRPSRTQLLRDADTFEHYRIRSVARKWFAAALQASHSFRLLEQKASAHDAGRLLHEALEHWQHRVRSKRHASETERFFNRLELRAGKARDLYLLSKAFTHWAECAYEVGINTSTARRHILRLKYFNAWLEITAVNVLKVRRLRLQKFFTVWQQRYVRVVTDETRAALLHKDNLHKLGYWRWFWVFCERRAPEWRAIRLKKKYFSKWMLVLRQDSLRNYQATVAFNEKIAKRTLAQWLAKARIVLAQTREAGHFDQQKIYARQLSTWRSKTYHVPLARQVSNMVDWRVAGTTFAVFVSRYRVEGQAEEINRLRLLRNAWTQWNDRLRWRALAHQIDDRVVIEALYKWVLAERFVLLRRLYQERLKQRHLSKLMTVSYNVQAQRNGSVRAFESERTRRSLHSILIHWRQRSSSYGQDEEVAFQFHAPRIAQENLRKWASKLTHSRKLNGWAKDAEYYFVATRNLKRWRTAAIESKRRKRREAYVQIRRKSKVQLATRYLAHWRGRTARTLGIQERAERINQDRLLRYGTNTFDKWHTLLSQHVHLNDQAEEHYSLVLMSQYVYHWRQRLQARSDSEEFARLFFEPHLSSLASSCLHKCRLRMIEYKALTSKAVSFQKTYDKRHIRQHLRQWQAKTIAKQNVRSNPDRTTSSRARRHALQAEADGGDEGLTTRAEEWTALDLGEWIPSLETQSSSTPLPGYLSTPSKRAARARALVRVSTTPAGTPLGRRQGSQVATEPRTELGTGRRVAFRRSIVGARVGNSVFGPILEDESPRTPGGPP